MKTEARIFLIVMTFCFVAAAVYLPWSGDPIGGTALIVSGGLCGLCGFYFAFVARRIGARPEDRGDADISEGSGELGFFSPGSYWPVGIAGAASIAGLGLVYWPAYWLIAVGIVAILVTAGGLLFEYYVK